MIYNPTPNNIKFMTKEADHIIHGICDIISKYTDHIEFSINILENAARLCTVAKYLGIAKRWVKVPKTKSYDKWVSSLSNFDVFFEKRINGIAYKGLSITYRNREETAIYWDEKFWNTYMLCSRRLLSNWSSYDEMDMIIEWSKKYDQNTISRAFDIADRNNALSVKYINAILNKEQLIVEYNHSRELERITKCESSPLKKCERTIFDVLHEMEIAEKARLHYEEDRRRSELNKIFDNMKDEV